MKTKISEYNHAHDPQCHKKITVEEFCNNIKTGKHKAQIEEIRKYVGVDDKVVDTLKSKLPCVTMAACGDYRKDPNKQFTGWMQCDIDKIGLEAAIAARQSIATNNDPHILAAFISPSGEGLKMIMKIDPNESDANNFKWGTEHLMKNYKLTNDPAVKDVRTRIFFTSYDPDIYINQNELEPVQGAATEIQELAITTVADVVPIISKPRTPIKFDASATKLNDAPTIAGTEAMLTAIASKTPVPEYQDWIRLASGVMTTHGKQQGINLMSRVFPEIQAGEYDKLASCHMEQININTVADIAKRCGYDLVEHGRKFGSKKSTQNAQLRFESTQLDEAKLWCSMSPNFVWVPEKKAWFRYADGIWTEDRGETVAVDISKKIGDIWKTELNKSKQNNKKDEDESKWIDTRIKTIQSCVGMRHVENIAKSLQYKCFDEFDANHNLLVLNNGTFNFSTFELEKHSLSHYATIKTDINYDVKQKCPEFENFLNYFLENNYELIKFMQKAVGYTLTGSVQEQVMFFMHGVANSGKSTFSLVLSMLLNDLGTTIPIDCLMEKGKDSNIYKAELQGKRLVLTDEIEQQCTLRASTIKQIVSIDRIAARGIYSKPVVFAPTHKMWMIGNHRPEIKATDDGIWRRICLIPWNKKVGKIDIKRDLIMQAYKNELAGIFNWAVEGLQLKQSEGFDFPEIVKIETQQYREDNDQLGSYLAEHPVINDTELKAFCEGYREFFSRNGEFPLLVGNRKIAAAMRERGYSVKGGEDNKTTIFPMQ